MSEVKHTPGPWSFRIYSTDDDPEFLRKHGMEPVLHLTNEGQRFVMSESGRVALVDCHTEYKRSMGYKQECVERDANARLIAAAPDLLEALQELLDAGDHCLNCDDDTEAMLRFGKAHDDARVAIAKALGS